MKVRIPHRGLDEAGESKFSLGRLLAPPAVIESWHIEEHDLRSTEARLTDSVEKERRDCKKPFKHRKKLPSLFTERVLQST